MKKKLPPKNHIPAEKTHHPVTHSFVICAYKESPYLASCIRSLQEQRIPAGIQTRILISTSTPCTAMLQTAREMDIPVIMHGSPDIPASSALIHHKVQTSTENCATIESGLYENCTTNGAKDSEGIGTEPCRSGDSELSSFGSSTSGIATDWNAALAAADTDYVTLVHQDDRYDPGYLTAVMEALHPDRNPARRSLDRAVTPGEPASAPAAPDDPAPAAAGTKHNHTTARAAHPLIAFTDYYEIRDGERTEANENLGIKRLLLLPLRSRHLQGARWAKRFALCLGNSICCPAVTYVKASLPENPFKGNMGSNIDWQLWEELSRQKGSFVYIPRRLMGHRIHQESTTSELIGDSRRAAEDLYMLERFWPKGIAGAIEHFYKRAEKSNQI